MPGSPAEHGLDKVADKTCVATSLLLTEGLNELHEGTLGRMSHFQLPLLQKAAFVFVNFLKQMKIRIQNKKKIIRRTYWAAICTISATL
jgi:hypothetical protein